MKKAIYNFAQGNSTRIKIKELKHNVEGNSEIKISLDLFITLLIYLLETYILVQTVYKRM
jgi:hypothetical protein